MFRYLLDGERTITGTSGTKPCSTGLTGTNSFGLTSPTLQVEDLGVPGGGGSAAQTPRLLPSPRGRAARSTCVSRGPCRQQTLNALDVRQVFAGEIRLL